MNKTKHPALLFPVLPPDRGQFAATPDVFHGFTTIACSQNVLLLFSECLLFGRFISGQGIQIQDRHHPGNSWTANLWICPFCGADVLLPLPRPHPRHPRLHIRRLWGDGQASVPEPSLPDGGADALLPRPHPRHRHRPRRHPLLHNGQAFCGRSGADVLLPLPSPHPHRRLRHPRHPLRHHHNRHSLHTCF